VPKYYRTFFKIIISIFLYRTKYFGHSLFEKQMCAFDGMKIQLLDDESEKHVLLLFVWPLPHIFSHFFHFNFFLSFDQNEAQEVLYLLLCRHSGDDDVQEKMNQHPLSDYSLMFFLFARCLNLQIKFILLSPKGYVFFRCCVLSMRRNITTESIFRRLRSMGTLLCTTLRHIFLL